MCCEHAPSTLFPSFPHLRIVDAKVLGVVVLEPARLAPHVDVRHDQVDHLLARPQRLRLEHCWQGHYPIPILKPHENGHKHVSGDKRVAAGHQAAPQQRVLHNADDGAVGLRRDDIAGYRHNFLELCSRLRGLWHVHVHLVAVEISVVGRGDRQVKSEGGVGQDSHAVGLCDVGCMLWCISEGM